MIRNFMVECIHVSASMRAAGARITRRYVRLTGLDVWRMFHIEADTFFQAMIRIKSERFDSPNHTADILIIFIFFGWIELQIANSTLSSETI
jgi:hypothetical protein